MLVSLQLLDPPQDVAKVIAGWLLLAWFGGALAIALGALSHRYELVDKLWHPAAYLLFPLSGAAFMVSALPPFAQAVVLWIPTVHGVEMVRDGWFGDRALAIYDLGYLIPVNLVLTLYGLLQARRVAAIVVPE